MTKQRLSSPYDALPPADSTMTIAARSLGVACGGGLTVTLHSTDDVRVIVLDGAVGPDSRRGLCSALNAAFMSSPRRIVIDASHVTDCDRQGLVAFKDAADRALAGGIPLTMSGLPAPHREMLRELWSPQVSEDLSYPSLQSASSPNG